MSTTSDFLKAYKAKKAGKSSSSIARTTLQDRGQKATDYNSYTQKETPKAVTPNNFGDVSQKSTFSGTKTPGATLSTGKTFQPTALKPLSQGLSVYGQNAINSETRTPGTITKRNDQIASNLFSQGQTSQEQVAKYLQGQTGFSNATGQDQTNTVRAITERLAGMQPQEKQGLQQPIQEPVAQPTAQDQAMGIAQQGLDQDLAGLRSEKGTDDFVKRMDAKLEETGQKSLTPEQIEGIRQEIGMSQEDAQKTNDARQRERDVFNKSGDRSMEDMTLTRERNIMDADKQHARVQESINNQIGDVERQMNRSVASGTKMGALSGQGNSSGYTQGLNNIKADAQRTMARLQVQADQDTDDTIQYKTRIGEDYEKGMSRTKTDMSDNMRELRVASSGQVQAMVEKYGTNNDLLTSQLDKIQEEFGTRGQEAFTNYLANVKGITDTAYAETEKIQELQQAQQQIEQVNVNNLLDNNGLALSSMTDQGLQDMVTSGDLSTNNYNIMKSNMLGLASSSLSQLGQPSSEDITQLQGMIENGGMTPTQAIQSIAGQNPDRYDPLKAKSFDDLLKQQTMQLNQAKFQQGANEFNQVNALNQAKFQQGAAEFGQTQALKLEQFGLEKQEFDNNTRAETVETYGNMIQQTGGGAEGIATTTKSLDGTNGGQCGVFANNIINGATGTKGGFGDSIESKINYVNKNPSVDASGNPTPSIGGAIVMTAPGSAAPNGHVGVVTGVNPDGSIEMTSSNFHNNEMVSTDTLQANDPRIKAFMNAPVEETGETAQKNKAAAQKLGLYDISGTKGGKAPSATERSNLSAGRRDAVNAINKVLGTMEDDKYVSGIPLGAAAISPRASDTKEAKQQFMIASQVVGKFLEGGKLAEGDISRYQEMLPSISDTKEVAKRKMENVKDLVVENYNGQLDTLGRAGLDVSEYEYVASKDDIFSGGKQQAQVQQPVNTTSTSSSQPIDSVAVDNYYASLFN